MAVLLLLLLLLLRAWMQAAMAFVLFWIDVLVVPSVVLLHRQALHRTCTEGVATSFDSDRLNNENEGGFPQPTTERAESVLCVYVGEVMC